MKYGLVKYTDERYGVGSGSAFLRLEETVSDLLYRSNINGSKSTHFAAAKTVAVKQNTLIIPMIFM